MRAIEQIEEFNPHLESNSPFGSKQHLLEDGKIKIIDAIGAQIRISVRRVSLALAAGYPFRAIFAQVYTNLMSTA